MGLIRILFADVDSIWNLRGINDMSLIEHGIRTGFPASNIAKSALYKLRHGFPLNIVGSFPHGFRHRNQALALP